MKPDGLGELLLLEARDVDEEIPHLVPQVSDLLCEHADVGTTGRVEETIATRKAQRGGVWGRRFHELPWTKSAMDSRRGRKGVQEQSA